MRQFVSILVNNGVYINRSKLAVRFREASHAIIADFIRIKIAKITVLAIIAYPALI